MFSRKLIIFFKHILVLINHCDNEVLGLLPTVKFSLYFSFRKKIFLKIARNKSVEKSSLHIRFQTRERLEER